MKMIYSPINSKKVRYKPCCLWPYRQYLVVIGEDTDNGILDNGNLHPNYFALLNPSKLDASSGLMMRAFSK